MKVVCAFVSLAILYCTVESKTSSPKVQVYSRDPGQFGLENNLICKVSNFHPPDITITILKDGVVIPNSMQTDLAFKKGWQFHLTKHVPFTPLSGEKYICRVVHGQTSNDYAWEPEM
ncbi:beta-2-microglobulin-like isoform 1-T1 [Polymixia lowei]